MRAVKIILFVAVSLLFLIFVAQHAYYVEINFLGITYKVPLFVIVLFSFSIGFLLPALYFSFKDVKQRGLIEDLLRGIKELSRGYPQRAEKALWKALKKREEVSWLLAKALSLREDLQKIQELKGSEVFVGVELLRKGDHQKAKELLLSALSKDRENLTALKGMRDLSFLEENLQECIKYQEDILRLCEKWEREKQNRIHAEVLAYASEKLSDKKEELIKEAVDTYRTFYTQAVWIKYLMEKGDIKEARKEMEKAFKSGEQNEVLMILSGSEETLTKLMDLIKEKEAEIHPDALARIYIKLNLFTQLREILDKVSPPIRTMAVALASHRDESKMCAKTVEELYKPWECSCGECYNNYTPMCYRCFTWGNITLRGIKDASGHSQQVGKA